MASPNPIVLSLDSANASLDLVGGKARSLAKLAKARMPVPPGFLLTTGAYRDFVASNKLENPIVDLVADIAFEDAASVESASRQIRAMFEGATVPSDVIDSITQAYAALGEDPPVAVRSSATAEDLPDLSFAGQQDTYLNVRGEQALLDAVRRCWASLWTARAIGYRATMGVDHRAVSMGVVIQAMVEADASGVLFTANPTSGDRSELIVNASFGLGEAIVGGQVTPDTYVLDRNSLATRETLVGHKEQMVVSTADQGTALQPIPEDQRTRPSLPPEQLNDLAALSVQVEALFDNQPQDIEWAIADGVVWLLQARPITNLPPAPLSDVRWDPPREGTKLVRRQVVENMPQPLSPLFDELYLRVGMEEAIDRFVTDFGMNVDIGLFVERPFFLTVNGYAYCRGSYLMSWRLLAAFPGILYAYFRILPRLLRNLKRQWEEEGLPDYLGAIEQQDLVNVSTAADHQLLAGVRALSVADANHWFHTSIIVAAAKVTDGLLDRFLKSWFVPGDLNSGMFLRGFPSKTIDAQIELEAIARRVRRDDAECSLVRRTSAQGLLSGLRHDPAGQSLLQELEDYLDRYGHQVYNLDFVEPTQIEDPTTVLVSLKALVEGQAVDTRARQAELVRQRDALIEDTLTSLGPIRRWLFRKLLGWAQNFGPGREEALFYMGAAWSTLRRQALELGERLVAAGALSTADDVFYLEYAEIEAAIAARQDPAAGRKLQQLARERRELRDARKRLHPPGMVPEGSRWKFGPIDMSTWETQKRNVEDATTLNGFGVSPGKVSGIAAVVMAPSDVDQMSPGTILVCPTTTPAWTPLFAHAAGLVTDIGGILAHGSIVAREYGIPAVLGTGNGTRRIATGQKIEVDGDAGTVTLLE